MNKYIFIYREKDITMFKITITVDLQVKVSINKSVIKTMDHKEVSTWRRIEIISLDWIPAGREPLALFIYLGYITAVENDLTDGNMSITVFAYINVDICCYVNFRLNPCLLVILQLTI